MATGPEATFSLNFCKILMAQGYTGNRSTAGESGCDQAVVKRNTTIRDRHRAIIRRGEPPCWICGEAIDYTLPAHDQGSFVVDHKVSLARGGPDTLENKAAAHRRCNRAKGAKAHADQIRRSGVGARVESGSDLERRVTATRLVALGVLAFGAKKKRGGESWLTVEGPDVFWTEEVKRGDAAKARKFAAAVNDAAKKAA